MSTSNANSPDVLNLCGWLDIAERYVYAQAFPRFEQAAPHCFWMRNTPLPLSIAFIDDSGRIAGLADMQPHTDTLHCPATEVRYALEVQQGGFRQRGIAAGMQVSGLPR